MPEPKREIFTVRVAHGRDYLVISEVDTVDAGGYGRTRDTVEIAGDLRTYPEKYRVNNLGGGRYQILDTGEVGQRIDDGDDGD